MKKKFTRILGVALPLVLVLALAISLVPAVKSDTADAAVVPLRFTTLPLPKYVEDGGKYVLVHDMHIGAMDVTPAGNVLFAAANTTSANMTTLVKSGDGGYSWTVQAGFRTAALANADNSSIVAIECSPEYSTDSTVMVATEQYV